MIPSMMSIDSKDFLSHQLHLMTESAVKMASQVYERELNLSLREVRVLRAVGVFPGIGHYELVERVLFEKSLVSRLIAGLIKRSYLTREIDQKDARRVSFTLTGNGVEVLRKADAVGMALNEAWLSVLSPDEARSLNACIDKLSEAVKDL